MLRNVEASLLSLLPMLALLSAGVSELNTLSVLNLKANKITTKPKKNMDNYLRTFKELELLAFLLLGLNNCFPNKPVGDFTFPSLSDFGLLRKKVL